MEQKPQPRTPRQDLAPPFDDVAEPYEDQEAARINHHNQLNRRDSQRSASHNNHRAP